MRRLRRGGACWQKETYVCPLYHSRRRKGKKLLRAHLPYTGKELLFSESVPVLQKVKRSEREKEVTKINVEQRCKTARDAPANAIEHQGRLVSCALHAFACQ